MKNLLPFFILVNLSLINKAQIVFCPPGAEWRYNFIHYRGYALTNESIVYMGKTVISGDTVKVLKHRYSFNQTNDAQSPYINTYLTQRGDTVFYKNKWAQNWQILYNFNVQAGQSWYGIYAGKYYQVDVDSVKYILVNSVSLKQLVVHYSNIDHPIKITERFGCSEYMFNYLFEEQDHGGILQDNLCYKDSTFGTIQLTNKPCNYVDYVGLNEETLKDIEVKVYPNPSNGKLNIDFSDPEKLKLVITKALGQEVLLEKVLDSKQELDVSHLPPGVYFLKLQKGNRQKTLRIVKTD